jgi:hypothetical protein
MKKFAMRTWVGVRKGFLTPTLSNEMLEFQRKPLIRIIRFLGGISWFAVLGRGYFDLHSNLYLLSIALFFVFIFFIYHTYISIHRFKHIKYLFKSGDLDVKN